MDRNFYHSFPRVRPGDEQAKIVQDGLAILKCVAEKGLILAPEIVTWKQSLVDGSFRTTTNRQVRICFTELDSSELPEHSKNFGPFSLEFDVVALRKIGALPVIYMPQHLDDGRNFSSIGASIVTHTSDVKYLINQLQLLESYLDINYIRKFQPDAQFIHPDAVFNLQNSDPNDPKKILHSYQIAFKAIKDFISYIGYRNAPFPIMQGILNVVQNLYYPTDDEVHNELLSYYRQREWRIISGAMLNGVSQSRLLNEEEKSVLTQINSKFWERELNDGSLVLKRKDEAVLIERYWDGHISNLISKVRVPKTAYESAYKIFGDRVIMNEFE